MKTRVDGIQKFRFCMGINPKGEEISKNEFDDIIKSWPRASTYNYADATIWRSPWMGEMKWIAMHHLTTKKFYKL